MTSPFDAEIKVGHVKKAKDFPETEKPRMMKLWIKIEGKEVQSAAQLGYNHKPDEVEGKMVLCAVDLGSIRIAGFKSEVLTLGVPDDDGNPVLVTPEREVPEGGELY